MCVICEFVIHLITIHTYMYFMCIHVCLFVCVY